MRASPSNSSRIYSITVSYTHLKKNVVIKIEGQEYWSYTVDFDSGEIVDSKKNPNFHLNSSSSSSSNPSSNEGNSSGSSSQDNSSGRED